MEKRSFVNATMILLVLVAGQQISKADLLTSSGSITSPTVINFSAFGGGGTCIFGAGPTSLGSGVTWSSTDSESVLGDCTYGLAANGSWGSPQHYAGLNTGVGTMTFTLSTPVSAIGAFMNYAPGFGPDVIISAYDGAVLLASYDINLLAPISTPGGFNEGAFRGISQPTADITSFTVSNSFVLLTDLTFGGNSNAIPEPSTLLLLGTGLIGLGGRARKFFQT